MSFPSQSSLKLGVAIERRKSGLLFQIIGSGIRQSTYLLYSQDPAIVSSAAAQIANPRGGNCATTQTCRIFITKLGEKSVKQTIDD
jgi:hypothetical protein